MILYDPSRQYLQETAHRIHANIAALAIPHGDYGRLVAVTVSVGRRLRRADAGAQHAGLRAARRRGALRGQGGRPQPLGVQRGGLRLARDRLVPQAAPRRRLRPARPAGDARHRPPRRRRHAAARPPDGRRATPRRRSAVAPPPAARKIVASGLAAAAMMQCDPPGATTGPADEHDGAPMTIQHAARGRIQRLLIANRGEIAIRVMRAANELGIRTVAIYSREDRFSLHRFKADESYLVGEGKGPVEAYLDIADIVRIAREAHCDAMHPGLRLPVREPGFRRGLRRRRDCVRRPHARDDAHARQQGRGARARDRRGRAGDAGDRRRCPPTRPRSPRLAAEVGYPLMLKASWGGGGRGMRVVESEAELPELVAAARREAKAAFGNDEVYLEKLIRRARHVEVQLLGDAHGNLVHLCERDCTVQRRNQKVVERAPAAYLDAAQRAELCELRRSRSAARSGYRTPARSSSCRTPTPAGSTSSRSTRASRSSTRSPRSSPASTSSRRRSASPRARRIGTPDSGVPPQDEIRSSATRCSAGSRPRTPRTTSSPTTARSPPTAAPPASASASTPAPPIAARSSAASTTRCWSR